MELPQFNSIDFTIQEITPQETWIVRHPVLRTGRPIEDCFMEGDHKTSTFHLGLYQKLNLIGVATFMNDANPNLKGKQYRLRGMAVLAQFSNKGYGGKLLQYGEELLRQKTINILWFNARKNAIPFYLKHGYTIDSPFFEIPTIGPHVMMKKNL